MANIKKRKRRKVVITVLSGLSRKDIEAFFKEGEKVYDEMLADLEKDFPAKEKKVSEEPTTVVKLPTKKKTEGQDKMEAKENLSPQPMQQLRLI